MPAALLDCTTPPSGDPACANRRQIPGQHVGCFADSPQRAKSIRILASNQPARAADQAPPLVPPSFSATPVSSASERRADRSRPATSQASAAPGPSSLEASSSGVSSSIAAALQEQRRGPSRCTDRAYRHGTTRRARTMTFTFSTPMARFLAQAAHPPTAAREGNTTRIAHRYVEIAAAAPAGMPARRGRRGIGAGCSIFSSASAAASVCSRVRLVRTLRQQRGGDVHRFHGRTAAMVNCRFDHGAGRGFALANPLRLLRNSTPRLLSAGVTFHA